MIAHRLTKGHCVRTFLLASVFALATAGAAYAAQGDCGQPVSDGVSPVSADCLFIIQASLDLQTCSPGCICDVNAMGGITATDALLCLQVSVGQDGAELACDCSGTTTTSTTTTTLPTGVGDVINESCAVCHADGRTADVADVHPGLQTYEDVIASIDGVAIDVDDMAQTAVLTVDFTVTDPDGSPIPGLGAESMTRPGRFAYLRFALAELMPPVDGIGHPDT